MGKKLLNRSLRQHLLLCSKLLSWRRQLLRLLPPPQSCQHRLLPQSCQHRLLRLLVLAMAQALSVEELAMAHLSSRRLVLAMATMAAPTMTTMGATVGAFGSPLVGTSYGLPP